MSRLARVIALAALAVPIFTACRQEAHRSALPSVAPPVSDATAIPDAPVSGTLHGKQFVVRDARYIVDRRVGYVHTDIKLSAGKAETPCGPILPAHAPSVWLRLDGERLSAANELRLAPGDAGPWSVHYQVFDDERWFGVGDGSAIVSIREPGAEGRLSGGLGVCFPDEHKSCVSGSFEAQSCPPSIDQPVRGALPAEAVPPRLRLQLLDAGQ